MNNCLERKAIEAIVVGSIRRRRERYKLPIVCCGGDDKGAVGKAEMMMMMTVTAVIKYRWQINLSISNRSQSFKSV